MKRLRNLARCIHRSGLATSYMVTLTPLAYPITTVLVAPLVVVAFMLDPDEYEAK